MGANLLWGSAKGLTIASWHPSDACLHGAQVGGVGNTDRKGGLAGSYFVVSDLQLQCSSRKHFGANCLRPPQLEKHLGTMSLIGTQGQGAHSDMAPKRFKWM